MEGQEVCVMITVRAALAIVERGADCRNEVITIELPISVRFHPK